jgi:hypothetical protein
MYRLILASVLIASATVRADDDAALLDRVEVTGSRISYRDLLDTPAISITKPGDYLLQKLTLVNDTRSEDGRRSEIHATIEKMLARTGSRYQLLYGDYRTVLDRSNYRIEVSKNSKRNDVSDVSLYVRVELGDDPAKAEQLIKGMREYIKASDKIGRTEIDVESETALGMNQPERYRYELIAAIADDTRKLGAALGGACKVELDGLNSRLEWVRVSAGELMLYIPYRMTVSDCATPVAAR